MHITRTLAFAFLFTAPAVASTRFVNGSLTTGANDGSSWANAYRGADAVAVAIAAAQPGDEIWVAAGVYIPNTTSTRTLPFLVDKDVDLYGGFAGAETQLAQRDFAANVTVLSGDLAGDDASGAIDENTFHVVRCTTAAGAAVLDGFTVSGGNANGGVASNRTGGGLLCDNGATAAVRNCRFERNSASSTGGGASVLSPSATFADCVFDGNDAFSSGGGLYASSTSSKVDRCTFVNNGAQRGAAVEIDAGLVLTNSLIHQNQCGAAAEGGAVSLRAGAGIQVVNCTIVGNTAPGGTTGGIAGSSSGTASVANCIVFGNTSASSGSATNINPTNLPGVSYTLTQNGHPGTGNVAATPVFEACGPIAYVLAPHSPGIDAGDNSAVPAGASFDVFGAPRFLDVAHVADSGAGTAPIVDMGSWEGSDCNLNGVTDWCDIDSGLSLDGDGNRVPDECQCTGGADCNGNGVCDPADIALGHSSDINSNGVPDDCECLGAPDCNANGVLDACDISSGTAFDRNSNGVPDDCECSTTLAPFTYCTAQLNSQFCLPRIGFSGSPSLSSGAPFLITASDVLNNRRGMLIYSHEPNAAPVFNFATLCVKQPFKRTFALMSGGTPTGFNCSGLFTFDFNAWIASSGDVALQIPGQQVNAQIWSRDPADPFKSNMTDAVQFVICQ